MTRDLGAKAYFRVTTDELANLNPADTVTFTLPEGKMNIPVHVLLDRFSTSKTWLGKGWHSSSTFPQWLADYLEGAPQDANHAVVVPAGTNEPQARKSKIRKSGATDSQRQVIRQDLFATVAKLAASLGMPPEAVVLEMRYFHESATNPYRTNASKADKAKSLKHHQNRCQAAGCTAILTSDTAVFHHLRRGFAGQHEPENLLPYCESCHDAEHDLPAGKSLSKGSKK